MWHGVTWRFKILINNNPSIIGTYKPMGKITCKITLIFGSYHPEPPSALSRGLGHRRVGCIHGPTSRKEKDNNALGLGDYRDAELKCGFEVAKWLEARGSKYPIIRYLGFG